MECRWVLIFVQLVFFPCLSFADFSATVVSVLDSDVLHTLG